MPGGRSNILSLQSVPVKHCPDAWGLVVNAVESLGDARRTMTVVYSGDTRCGPESGLAGSINS